MTAPGAQDGTTSKHSPLLQTITLLSQSLIRNKFLIGEDILEKFKKRVSVFCKGGLCHILDDVCLS